jgi:hypothetical protein
MLNNDDKPMDEKKIPKKDDKPMDENQSPNTEVKTPKKFRKKFRPFRWSPYSKKMELTLQELLV